MTVAADPMLPRHCNVARTIKETHDTFTVLLKDESAPKFLPGQFNMLYVYGVGESAISISGDPAGDDGWVHTVRAVGTVTSAMRKVRAGGAIGVRGPFGTPWPVEEAKGRDVVLVAGGIGLAPLRPVIYHLLRHRGDYGRVELYYGTRTPADVLYPRELQRWRGRFDIDVHVTVDRGDDSWSGSVGVVTAPLALRSGATDNTVAMLCGPEIMMRFTMRELQKQHMPLDRIFISMERNMKCAVGFCGHCQLGPTFICRDGPVYRADAIASMLTVREL